MAEEVIIPIVAICGFFGSIILFVYLFFSSRHKERMALIQSGRDAGVFRQPSKGEGALKYGLVGFMIGVGILLAHLVERAGLPGVVAYFSMILIMGSFGLVLYYWYFEKKKDARETERERDLL
jgi:hypothetical protein